MQRADAIGLRYALAQRIEGYNISIGRPGGAVDVPLGGGAMTAAGDGKRGAAGPLRIALLRRCANNVETALRDAGAAAVRGHARDSSGR